MQQRNRHQRVRYQPTADTPAPKHPVATLYVVDTPIGNLWLTVANRFGSEQKTFGQSTGTIELFG